MVEAGDGGGVPNGAELLAFVEAILGVGSDLVEARKIVRTRLGDAAFVDACATAASFNAVVKLADGTGIPLEAWKAERTHDLRAELGIEAFRN